MPTGVVAIVVPDPVAVDLQITNHQRRALIEVRREVVRGEQGPNDFRRPLALDDDVHFVGRVRSDRHVLERHAAMVPESPRTIGAVTAVIGVKSPCRVCDHRTEAGC